MAPAAPALKGNEQLTHHVTPLQVPATPLLVGALQSCSRAGGECCCTAGAEDGEPLATYTIVTTDSSQKLSWLHDRWCSRNTVLLTSRTTNCTSALHACQTCVFRATCCLVPLPGLLAPSHCKHCTYPSFWGTSCCHVCALYVSGCHCCHA
jgi:hypothetical protein